MATTAKKLVSLLLFCLFLGACTQNSPRINKNASTDGAVLEVFSEKPKELEQVSEWLSHEIVVDDIYKSMMGPGRQDYVAIDRNRPQLAWLTGYSVEVVKPDGETPLGQQYLCHSNLELADVNLHYMQVANKSFNPGRYFTISQGQQEASLPEGMGIPINTSHPFNWNGQALNLNGKPSSPITTHQKIRIKYVLDSSLEESYKPLFAMSLVGLKTVGDLPADYTITHQAAPSDVGGCLVGTSAVKDGVFTDAAGNEFTAHWVVEPGVEENTTRLDDIFTIPYDTKMHYAMLHVHAFCESVELYDLTAKKSVLKFDCTQFPDKIGLLKTQELSSIEGIPVYKDHKYEIRSRYNNTTKQQQDAMVVLYVYLEDKSFDKTKL